ncbi:hypothetical protein TNCV_816321 [Trichonephila clavipes]|nr:hypothetical protein TNCV_816321 [Trichonephila clavipes]
MSEESTANVGIYKKETLLLLMPPDQQCQIDATKIIVAKGPVVSRIFEHHACDSTMWLGSTPILRENTLVVVQRPPTFLPLPPTSQNDM